MRPSFFIVGAPKCGTTALSHYLRGHPSLFLCQPKEPFFFCDDLPAMRKVRTEAEYLGLFAGLDACVRRAGEATAMYLFSQSAIPNLRKFDEEAKLIVLLRNPVDLAHAYHATLLFARLEDEPNFWTAWSLQEQRGRGERIPRWCPEASILQYRKVALLGEQVQRLLAVFPLEQVKIILFDDLVANTRGVYEDVLRFLGVSSDNRLDFPPVNENRRTRLGWVATVTTNIPAVISSSVRQLKQAMGLRDVGLLDAIRRANAETVRRSPLAQAEKAALLEGFSADIQALSTTIDRDLGHWLRI